MEKVYLYMRNESTIFIIFVETLFLHNKGDRHFCYKTRKSIQPSQLIEFFLQNQGNIEE